MLLDIQRRGIKREKEREKDEREERERERDGGKNDQICYIM